MYKPMYWCQLWAMSWLDSKLLWERGSFVLGNRRSGETDSPACIHAAFDCTPQVNKRPRAWFGAPAPGSPGVVRNLATNDWSGGERRRSVRYPLKLPVVIVAADGNSLSLPAQTCNISSTGVLVRCSEELVLAQAVDYVVKLYPEYNLRLRCKGRVARIERLSMPSDGAGRVYTLAITIEAYEFVRSARRATSH